MTYYHVRLTPKGKGQDTEYLADLSEEELEERFLKPRRDGDPVTINGRTVSVDDIGRMKITKSEVDSSQLRRVLDLSTRDSSVPGLEPSLTPGKHRVVDQEIDVTNDLIVGPPGRKSAANREAVQEPRTPQNTREVFVVHGRNEKARKALFDFLRSIGLSPLEWPSMVQATNAGSPYIGDILNKAINGEHAVVVLLTPDDEARLRETLRNPADKPYESELTGQARPNVLFEAGMAMGRSEERTIFVELGELRPFTDVAGRHTIKLNNTSPRRQELAQRLRDAGCPVNLDGTDWHDAGDFEAAIREIAEGQNESAADVGQLSILPETSVLTKDAIELVKAASCDYEGLIRVARTEGGLVIRTNYKDFGERGNARSQAQWEQALKELIAFKLVERESIGGTSYKVTHKGFQFADSLGV